MIPTANPFSSCEVRWFLDGGSSQYPAILHWFESYVPYGDAGRETPREWQNRLGGEPDVYLLLPGVVDIGIKWREGMLQIKGLVAESGACRFADSHEGTVQHWVKWTYSDLPDAIRADFDPAAEHARYLVPVTKARALRMIALDQPDPAEVKPGIVLERGLGFELTDMVVDGGRYCSLAFEAFPDDGRMEWQFHEAVDRLLKGLPDSGLTLEASSSYPGWLSSLFAGDETRQSPQSPQAATTGKTTQ